MTAFQAFKDITGCGTLRVDQLEFAGSYPVMKSPWQRNNEGVKN